MMDELDRIARRAADEVRAQADTVADTEQSLRDVHDGVHLAPVVALPERRRWLVPVLAAASIVAVVAGVVGVVMRDDPQPRVSSTDSSAPDTAPAPSTTDDAATLTTLPGTTLPNATVTTEAPASTVPAPARSLDLGHGLAATLLPDVPSSIRTVDTFGFQGLTRADAVTELTFPDGRVVRFRLGALDTITYPLRTDAPELGEGGWTVEGQSLGQVAGAAGFSFGDDVWVQAESLRQWDDAAQAWGDRAFTIDELRIMLASLEYDPSLDDRARVTSTGVEPSVDTTSPCESGDDVVTGSGGTTGDLVLFTCEGVLARYDATTGEQVEVIATFPGTDPRVPTAGDEGGDTPYVDSMAISPDGTTLWYSVGPEPVSDTLYRYVFGSGVEPEAISDGIVSAVSPDGRWVATTTAMPSIDLRAADTSTAVYDPSDRVGIDTYQTYLSAPVWSPDSSTLVAEAYPNGALAVIDVATGSISMHAPLDGQVYLSPWYTSDGVLHALVDDGTTVQEAVVGPAGNAAPIDPRPTSVPANGRVALTAAPSGSFAVLEGGRLGRDGATWATGVIAAAVVPGA